jgi:hypothetical protein
MSDGLGLSSAVTWIAISFILGVAIAPAIYRDAKSLPRLFLGTSPWFWALCAPFIGPLATLFVYWAIHHSTISNRANSSGKGS